LTVERYKDSKLRAVALNLDCDSSPADLFPKALGYDLSTRITLNLDNADNPGAIPMKSYHIEAITHEWHAWQDCWHTKWQLWDVNQYCISRVQHDGYLQASGAVYATVQAQASANETCINDFGFVVGQINDGATPYHIERAYIEFPSPAIPVGATIIGASVLLHLHGTSAFVIDNAFDIVLVNPGLVFAPVVATNYGDLLPDTINLGSLTINTPSIDIGWIEIPLNALGLSTINKSAINHFALRSSRDITAITPPTENEFIGFDGLYSSGTTLSGYLPRLVIQLG
jgi:hypothetical protein